ncbi:MAG: 16S rRNA (cytosine(967)-C(5))-methyltransferase RsmB [Deltaproteobacteria bacterium]|nr:16S rRNA (cytosine(967)-C(5))-methyltransferase RsmB [Deltaproteobacteria bacterium]
MTKSKGARGAAFRVLNRVEAGDSYADILLEAELENLSEADSALAMEITNGVLRWRIRLDWAIDSFSSIKTKKLEHNVLNALRIGAYQILFLTRVPASAAINESVNLVKTGGNKKAGFVNAVLRKINSEKDNLKFPDFEKEPVKHISVVYSHPEWMVKRWVERFGLDEAMSLCEGNQIRPPKVLRVNTLKTTRGELFNELVEKGLDVKLTDYSPLGIQVFRGRLNPKDDRYYIQDEASQLVPLLLAPKAGEAILDACSAPGGKTTLMAQLMNNSGIIIALDKYAGRLRTVEESAQRLGVKIIKTMEADAAGPLRLPAEIQEFDAILCDAPCSGLGVLRRSPDIKYRRKEEDIKELSALQKSILENISRYLKKGGRIVYSTCTFEPEETDGVVKWFLENHKDFVLEKAGGYVPEDCKTMVDEPGFLRTYPHRHGTDGFFAARLRKL